MIPPKFLDEIWWIPLGAIVGGVCGLGVAFVLVGLMVSGGGAAQGIADMDFSYPFYLFGSIGALAGGFLGLMSWIRVSEPPRGEKVGPTDDLS